MSATREHMQAVAYRNMLKSREEFWKHLTKCGWTDKQITDMWKIAKGSGAND